MVPVEGTSRWYGLVVDARWTAKLADSASVFGVS